MKLLSWRRKSRFSFQPRPFLPMRPGDFPARSKASFQPSIPPASSSRFRRLRSRAAVSFLATGKACLEAKSLYEANAPETSVFGFTPFFLSFFLLSCLVLSCSIVGHSLSMLRACSLGAHSM